jgi:putative oxidoreductase
VIQVPSPIFDTNPRTQKLAFTTLRIFAGSVFAMHGYQKLFVFGIAGVQGAFTKMGAPLPMITGPLIGVLELFGGLALVIGLLTRLVALGLVADMLGAIVLVHFANGFWVPAGVEFVMTLMAAALALVLGGAGAYSVDEMIGRKRR